MEPTLDQAFVGVQQMLDKHLDAMIQNKYAGEEIDELGPTNERYLFEKSSKIAMKFDFELNFLFYTRMHSNTFLNFLHFFL